MVKILNNINIKKVHIYTIYLFISLLVFSKYSYSQGRIIGNVVDHQSKKALAEANLVLVGTQLGSASGKDGYFEIRNIPKGIYSIEISFIGYKTQLKDRLIIQDRKTLQINFELKREPVKLREIVVTPGHFSIMKEMPSSRQVLTKENLQNISLFGGDVHRSMTRLPGVTGNDFSAKFAIRGGGTEEILVLFDGIELYDPFHLKDIGGGVLSIIDMEAIGSIELLTGGFTANFGDKMSGVFNVNSSISSAQANRTSIGISLLNSRFFSQWQTLDKKGQFIISARRGYLDLLMKMTGNGNTFSPSYVDLLGIYNRRLSSKFSLSSHILYAGDNLKFEDKNSNKANNGYKNFYTWFTLNSALSKKIFFTSLLSGGIINHDRNATVFYYDGNINKIASDQRGFYFAGFKQDWSIEFLNNFYVRFGIDAKTYQAKYDYHKNIFDRTITASDTVIDIETTSHYLKPNGNEVNFYLSQRLRLLTHLTMEVGYRYDQQSFTKDKSWSPRINVVYSIGRQTSLKGGWGNFYQSQAIHELYVVDNITRFFPKELAEHRVVGLEHQFINGIDLRIEAYQKILKDIRPKFINLIGTLDIFPEISGDRTLEGPDYGEANGIELYLKQDIGIHYSWWFSYGFSEAKDWIVNRFVYRPFDQKHTVDLNFNIKPHPKWQVNVAWQFHSGWPYTKMYLEQQTDVPMGQPPQFILVPNLLRENRLSNYHRLDLRISRFFELSKGKMNIFIELINAYNQKNIKTVDYKIVTDDRGNTMLEKLNYYWLPIMPSAGISWEF